MTNSIVPMIALLLLTETPTVTIPDATTTTTTTSTSTTTTTVPATTSTTTTNTTSTTTTTTTTTTLKRPVKSPYYCDDYGSFRSISVDFYIGVPAVVCGEWLVDGEPALAPYADIAPGYYCRETDDYGYTFFAYWDTRLGSCEEALNRITFE